MKYLVFDVVIAALLVLTAWRGYRRGFILTFCGFLAIFVALIGASLVSNVLARPVSQAISPIIESSIQQVVADQLSGGDSSSQSDSSVPGFLQDPTLQEPQQDPLEEAPLEEILSLLRQSPVYRGFADALQEAVDEGMVAATANATGIISDYIAIQVARMVLFAVSFVLVLIVWFFLSHALDLAFKLPVLSTLNCWGGAALGLFKGAVLVFVACWLLKGGFLPQGAVHNTYLLRFFCTASPLTLFS